LIENNFKISIVTVVYNSEKYLEQTIQSVIKQTYENIEYIIIDGSSTDSTVNIIRKYENSISYWVSEKDDGIYDAMNKGSLASNGDFVIFMNAGDLFYNKNIITNVVNKIYDDTKVYFGRALINKEKLSWIYPSARFTEKNIKTWLKKSLPNHQAMFFPKAFYKSVKYNTKYKIGSDSDYKFKARKQCEFIFLDELVCKFELDGISSEFNSFKNTKQIMKDSWEISIEHEGLLYAFERQVKILSKYLMKKIVGQTMFSSIHHKIKS